MTSSGRPTYQRPSREARRRSASQRSIRASTSTTPWGPRRWAQSRRNAPSASSARRASPPAPRLDARRGRGRRPVADTATAAARLGFGRVGDPDARPPRRRRAARRRRVGVAAADRVGEAAIAAAVAVDAVAARRCRRRPPRRRRSAAAIGGRPRRPAARVPARHQQRVAAGPTMSPSTAPASTDVSWPGSPTRTSRASAPHRFDEPGHQRQRHHRRLVDDDHVVGQAVARGRGGSGCGCPGRQPSRRCSVDGVERQQLRRAPRRSTASSRASSCTASSAARRPCRSARPARRAAAARRPPRPARRAARGSARRSWSCRCRGRRRRPRHARADGRRGGERLAAGRLVAEQPGEPSPSSASSTPAAAHGQRAQVGGDLALLAPVAVEVQRACRRGAAAGPPGRPRRRPRAAARRRAAASPSGLRPGSAARSTGSSASTVAVVADRREVDAARGRGAAPRTASAAASSTVSSVAPAQRGERRGRRGRRRRRARPRR